MHIYNGDPDADQLATLKRQAAENQWLRHLATRKRQCPADVMAAGVHEDRFRCHLRAGTIANPL